MKQKHEINLKLMLSFDGSISRTLRDADVMAMYHSVVSHHTRRHMKIVQWLCTTHEKDSMERGVNTTITAIWERSKDLWSLIGGFEVQLREKEEGSLVTRGFDYIERENMEYSLLMNTTSFYFTHNHQ